MKIGLDEVKDESSPRPTSARSRFRSLCVMALVAVVSGLIWFFAIHSEHTIELSNVRVRDGFPPLVSVDYQVHKRNREPRNVYYLTARPRIAGHEKRVLVEFNSYQTDGNIMTLLPLAHEPEYELYIELEHPDRPGSRERVSNIVRVSPRSRRFLPP